MTTATTTATGTGPGVKRRGRRLATNASRTSRREVSATGGRGGADSSKTWRHLEQRALTRSPGVNLLSRSNFVEHCGQVTIIDENDYTDEMKITQMNQALHRIDIFTRNHDCPSSVRLCIPLRCINFFVFTLNFSAASARSVVKFFSVSRRCPEDSGTLPRNPARSPRRNDRGS